MSKPTLPPAAGEAAHKLGMTGLPIISGRFLGLYCVTNESGTPFSNFALATTEEDAAFIVRACNNHAALVEALGGCRAMDGMRMGHVRPNLAPAIRESPRRAACRGKGGGMNKLYLLPCPFCGDANPEVERLGTARQSMIVVCTNCGCRMESGDVTGLTKDSNLAWNRRHNPSQPHDHPTPTT